MFLKFLFVCLISIFAVSCSSKLDTKKSTASGSPSDKSTEDSQAEAQIKEIYGEEVYTPKTQRSDFYKYTTIKNTTVADRIFFDFDRSNIDKPDEKVLKSQAELLKANPDLTIEIGGYCDERGPISYNLGLGERRANSAKNYLITQGVDAKRIKIHSYGKEKPLVIGSTEEIYAQNRAAVVTFNE